MGRKHGSQVRGHAAGGGCPPGGGCRRDGAHAGAACAAAEGAVAVAVAPRLDAGAGRLAVGAHSAQVAIHDRDPHEPVPRIAAGAARGKRVPAALPARDAVVAEMNAAAFDAAHDFRGIAALAAANLDRWLS